METLHELTAALEAAKGANNFVLAGEIQAKINALTAKKSFYSANETLKKGIDSLISAGNIGGRSTKAPDGMSEGKYPAKITNVVLSTFNNAVNGVRGVALTDDGKHEIFGSMGKNSPEKIKGVSENDSCTIDVYKLFEPDNSTVKGLYCRIIL